MTEARLVTREQLAAACTNAITWDAGFHTEESVRALADAIFAALPVAAPAEGLDPERQVRRKSDPAPCQECDGLRCRLCEGWGMTTTANWNREHTSGTITQSPCPHDCPRPQAYFYSSQDAVPSAALARHESGSEK